METYQGIIHEEVMTNLKEKLHYDRFVHAEEFMLTEEEIKKLVAKMLPLLKIAPGKVAIIDCLPGLNWLARTGGFISCRLGITSIGRPLVCLGVRLAYRRLLRQVELFETRPHLFTLHR